jgi:hypothetical protein
MVSIIIVRAQRSRCKGFQKYVIFFTLVYLSESVKAEYLSLNSVSWMWSRFFVSLQTFQKIISKTIVSAMKTRIEIIDDTLAIN